MKHLYIAILFCIFLNPVVKAAKIWVGPTNGDWSNSANWSDQYGGSGGAAVPGAMDSVYFTAGPSVIHVDQQVSITYLRVTGNVTLYASTPITFTISGYLDVPFQTTLKDSTSENVPFNVVINGATKATARIFGDWTFEGRVPVNRLIAGATFIAQPGSQVFVSFNLNDNYGSFYSYSRGGQITFKKNTGTIISDKTSLTFSNTTNYVLDGNLDAKVPEATWLLDQRIPSSHGSTLFSAAASILIQTDMNKIEFPEAPELGRLSIDLPALSSDANLSLPNGTAIKGNFQVLNTNDHTLTLLAPTSATSSVFVSIGVVDDAYDYGGYVTISGEHTKVALAKASAASPSTNYFMGLVKNFTQTGGNFSLQDFNGATGSTTLSLASNLIQTGGTFYTNSTSTEAKFTLLMSDPPFNYPASGIWYSLKGISMSSGTIDNASHNVTLRIDHGVYSSYLPAESGVILNTPLSVGKLELVRSPLTTSAVNILTVTNPSPDAITLGGISTSRMDVIDAENTSTSYVNGPLRRATNSTDAYLFPTGKGNRYLTAEDINNYRNSFHSDSCFVIPASEAPSIYQAEYYETGYPDNSVTAPLLGVSNSKYWNVSKISGADADVRLLLHETLPGAKARDVAVVATYNASHWEAANGTVLLPGNASVGVVTSKPFSAAGLFTLGYGDAAVLNPNNGGVYDGLHYKYYEGAFRLLPDFNSLTPVKTGTSPNFDLSIRRPGVNDSFAVVWEGYINIPAAGSYTFETISDDGSKLYFNTLYTSGGDALVDNDGAHSVKSVSGTVDVPAPGRYPVTVTYFENYGDQDLQVYWTGPGITRQRIPVSAFTDAFLPPVSGGLTYNYYEGSFTVLPDFNTLVPVKTGTSKNVDISVRRAGVNDNFAFTWNGTITIPSAGTYTFETISDDGSKLTFDGNTIVINDGLHAANSEVGTVTVAEGVYPISISYFEKDGAETMQVYWSGPGISRQLIPDAAFSGKVVSPSSGGGLNYKFYQGDFNALPDFTTLTPLKTGTSYNADISVRPAGVNDHFAFVWEGKINLPAAGTYTLETISDDGSKLYFNGNIVVYNDGLHAPVSAAGTVTVPAAGAYPITISYFEKDGSETMQLYWSGPGFARQAIPDAAFVPQTTNAIGLNYKYYEGDFNLLPDYSTLTPVKTGTSANVDISVRTPGVNDHFAFIWDGYIYLPSAGTYTFETVSDDGSKVYFNMPYAANGNATVYNDGLHAPVSATGTVTVPAAGRYPIAITFFEKDGGESMQLYWTGPGIPRQLVPDAAFTTTNAVALNNGAQTSRLEAITDEHTAMKVYPNPFVQSFVLDYYSAGNNKKVSIGIYDMNGKLVHFFQPSNVVMGNNRWVVNLASKKISSGVYMAQVKVNGVPEKSIKLYKMAR